MPIIHNPGVFGKNCDVCGKQTRAGDSEELVKQTSRQTMSEPAEYDQLFVCGGCYRDLTNEMEPDPDVAYDEWCDRNVA